MIEVLGTGSVCVGVCTCFAVGFGAWWLVRCEPANILPCGVLICRIRYDSLSCPRYHSGPAGAGYTSGGHWLGNSQLVDLSVTGLLPVSRDARDGRDAGSRLSLIDAGSGAGSTSSVHGGVASRIDLPWATEPNVGSIHSRQACVHVKQVKTGCL